MDNLPKFRSATTEDGRTIVYDVPVFAECEKDGLHFDAAWIDDAVKYQQALETQSVTPVHIGHHGEAEPAKPAGAWFNTRATNLVTKFGKRVRGAIADLVFTSKEAAERAKRGELLWRSCEIPRSAATRQKPPRFRSLALLDKHAPHVDDLPALQFRHTEGDVEWESLDAAGGVLAFAASGDAVCVLMEPEAMPETAEKPRYRRKSDGSVVRIENGVEAPIKFEDDEKKDDAPAPDAPKDDTLAEPEASKVDALVEKIKGFKGTMEEIGMLRSALEALMASDAPAEEPAEEIVDGPGDPITPMQDTDAVVSLRAEVEAMKKSLAVRDARAALDKAVDAAFERCKDRGVTREEVLAFAESAKDPIKGAATYADAMIAKVPASGLTFSEVMDVAASGRQAYPEEVLKFQNDGPDAFSAAAKDYPGWKKASDAGATRLTFDQWHAAGSVRGFARDAGN